MKIYEFLLAAVFLTALAGCNPTVDSNTKAFGKADLRDMIDFSSATINVTVPISVSISDVKGIAISSPTINVSVHALENYKYPVVGNVNVELFRNQSKATWLNWLILAVILFNFIVLVIHLYRIK